MRPGEKFMKFERIAERRVSEILNKLRLIGNLSDRRNYAYTDDHVKEIFDAIEAEVKVAKSRFRAEEQTGAPSFAFKKKVVAK
jgi:hypothetical protein